MPTNGFSTKLLKVKLLAGEQKATEVWSFFFWANQEVSNLYWGNVCWCSLNRSNKSSTFGRQGGESPPSKVALHLPGFPKLPLGGRGSL